MRPITIYIIDSQPLFRNGLISLLKLYPDFQTVGGAPTMAKALSKIPTLHPDVIFLDDHLPDVDGINAVALIKNCCPLTHVIMLSETSTDSRLFSTKQNTYGCLVKRRISITEVADSIRRAAGRANPALPVPIN